MCLLTKHYVQASTRYQPLPTPPRTESTRAAALFRHVERLAALSVASREASLIPPTRGHRRGGGRLADATQAATSSASLTPCSSPGLLGAGLRNAAGCLPTDASVCASRGDPARSAERSALAQRQRAFGPDALSSNTVVVAMRDREHSPDGAAGSRVCLEALAAPESSPVTTITPRRWAVRRIEELYSGSVKDIPGATLDAPPVLYGASAWQSAASRSSFGPASKSTSGSWSSGPVKNRMVMPDS
jgi:hypothetical protein